MENSIPHPQPTARMAGRATFSTLERPDLVATVEKQIPVSYTHLTLPTIYSV